MARVKKSVSKQRKTSMVKSKTTVKTKSTIKSKTIVKGKTTKNKTQAGNSTIYFESARGEFGFLSQWFKSPFIDEYGVEFLFAEQHMMHEKALVFEDKVAACEILKSTSVSDIKEMGRAVTGFDPERWDVHKTWIVSKGLYLKFTKPATTVKGKSLKQLLLDTGDRELDEAAPWDRYWGIGFGARSAEKNREKWGENILGRILMTIRTDIRMEDAQVRASLE